MASGILVDQSCIDVYNEIKQKHKHRYATFKIADDKKSIIVDEIGDLEQSYEDFVRQLPNAGRYAVFDYAFDAKKNTKLVFMMWNSDTLPIKEKMMYSSSVKYLKQKLGHTGTEMQCNDKDDLAVENINVKCQSKYT